MKRDSASNPLTERYASKEMSYLFSSNFKFRTWRRLWIALAEAERELGLPITDAQIAELKAHADDINFEDAERREREIRHDVMSHIYAYGLQAPAAKGIPRTAPSRCCLPVGWPRWPRTASTGSWPATANSPRGS